MGPSCLVIIPSTVSGVLRLGTTRAAAGGFDAQYKSVHELNTELAKAAKEDGIKTCVLITSTAPIQIHFLDTLR